MAPLEIHLRATIKLSLCFLTQEICGFRWENIVVFMGSHKTMSQCTHAIPSRLCVVSAAVFRNLCLTPDDRTKKVRNLSRTFNK